VTCKVGLSESGPISWRIDVKIQRCEWANNAALIDYHDHEWGVPIHNDRALFEFLVLEGMQAGLSWETVLRKRASYRVVFDDFDPATVAAYRRSKVRQLLANQNIIRNKLKIEAAIGNAKLVIALQKEFGSLDEYIWRFVGGRPRLNKWQYPEDVPAQTAESNELSKDMRRYGFRFAGPTICYALMQAVGMVNDHLVDCFRHKQVGSLA
jgi:DNA-3-methyladenine glycosylase I